MTVESPDSSSTGTLPGASPENTEKDHISKRESPELLPSTISDSGTLEERVNSNGKQVAGNHEASGTDESDEDGSSGSDEEQDEELEGDGEDEDEDDDEPALKYQRITGAIPDLFKKDSASALAVSNKMLVYTLHLSSAFPISHNTIGTWYACRHYSYPGPVGEAHKVVQTPFCFRGRHLVGCNRGFRRNRVYRRWVRLNMWAL